MKKLLLIALLLSAGIASAATFTATGNASLSSSTNWSPSQPTCAGGETIVTGAFTVTDDVANCKLGDAVGIGVSVSAAGGKFVINSGLTLALKGTGITTAVPWQTVANSTFDVSAANVTLLYDCAAYCAGLNNGIYLSSATTVSDVAAANIAWTTAGTTGTLTSRVAYAWDKANSIYVMHLNNGSTENAGPIANLAGTGLGSFGNTSISVTAGGFDSSGGTVHNEKSGCVPGWTDTSVLTTNGDFCVDYALGELWYKSSSGVLTVTITYKYGTWGGYGIISTANAANNNATVGGTYSHCGAVAQSGEFSGGGLMFDDMYAVGMPTDATRILTFISGLTFNYCSRPLMIQSDHITGSNASHHYVLTNPTFNYTQYASGLFQSGNIQIGASFVDITNPTLNSYAYMFNGTSRNSPTNIVVTGAAGGASLGNVLFNILPLFAVASSFTNCSTANPVSGFNNSDFSNSSNIDGAFISTGGSAGNINTYKNCNISHAYRDGRLDNYMDVEQMTFTQTNHHGFILASKNEYIDGTTITFKNNITGDLTDTGNFPGGFTYSYNQTQWVDSFTATHNTFDNGLRCLNFNDAENSVTLVTRAQAINNICSNNNQGIYLPTNGTSNLSALAIAKNDYNLDYNNTTNPTNLTQATFMMSGAEYNTGTRNVTGVYLFNPQGYTLPDATSRALVSTVSGTLGTRASGAINIAWSGGTAVNFVFDEGVLSAYSAAGSCPDSSTCSLLTDSTATWPITGSGLKTYQVIIVSGTGVGQYCMVASNTATAITCIANRVGNNVLTTALDTTSHYVIIKPDQQLFDSGAVNSVRAGIHSPTLVLTTQTDSGITMALNRPASANPNYAGSAYPTYNFHPKLSTLKGTGSDGLDIGALPVASAFTHHKVVIE